MIENIDHTHYRDTVDAHNDVKAAERVGYSDGLKGRPQTIVSRNVQVQSSYHAAFKRGKQQRIDIDCLREAEGLSYTEMMVKAFNFYAKYRHNVPPNPDS